MALWTPSELSSLIVKFDATDENSLDLAAEEHTQGGYLVNSWTDTISGNSPANTGNSRPRYTTQGGRPCVYFERYTTDTLSDSLNDTSPSANLLSGNHTIFIVANRDRMVSPAQYDRVLSLTSQDVNQGWTFSFHADSDTARLSVGTGAANSSFNIGLIDATVGGIICARFGSTTTTFYDGKTGGTTASLPNYGATPELSMALYPGPVSLKGGIFEVLIFNEALSLPNRQLVEGYLAHKWGTNASLDSNHPYYSTAPSLPWGHWTFDSANLNWSDTGTEIKDISGNNRHLPALNMSAANERTGKIGDKAIYLNGTNNDVYKLNLTGVPGSKSLSIAFWWKRPTGVGFSSTQVLSAFYRANSSTPIVDIAFDAGKLRFNHRNNTTVNPTDTIAGTTRFPEEEWHHVVLTTSSTHITGYYDGAQILQGDITSATEIVDFNIFTIGGRYSSGSFSNRMAGVWDDVRVYPYTLTSDEVAALYAYTGEPAGEDQLAAGSITATTAFEADATVLLSGFASGEIDSTVSLAATGLVEHQATSSITATATFAADATVEAYTTETRLHWDDYETMPAGQSIRDRTPLIGSTVTAYRDDIVGDGLGNIKWSGLGYEGEVFFTQLANTTQNQQNQGTRIVYNDGGEDVEVGLVIRGNNDDPGRFTYLATYRPRLNGGTVRFYYIPSNYTPAQIGSDIIHSTTLGEDITFAFACVDGNHFYIVINDTVVLDTTDTQQTPGSSYLKQGVRIANVGGGTTYQALRIRQREVFDFIELPSGGEDVFAAGPISSTATFEADGLVEHQAIGSITSTATFEATSTIEDIEYAIGSITSTATIEATGSIEGIEYAIGSIAATTDFTSNGLVEHQAAAALQITSNFEAAAFDEPPLENQLWYDTFDTLPNGTNLQGWQATVGGTFVAATGTVGDGAGNVKWISRNSDSGAIKSSLSSGNTNHAVRVVFNDGGGNVPLILFIRDSQSTPGPRYGYGASYSPRDSGGVLSVYKNTGYNFIKIADDIIYPTPLGEDFELALEGDGTTIRVYLNGMLFFTVLDQTDYSTNLRQGMSFHYDGTNAYQNARVRSYEVVDKIGEFTLPPVDVFGAGSSAISSDITAEASIDAFAIGSITATITIEATGTIEGIEYASGSIASNTTFEADGSVEHQADGAITATTIIEADGTIEGIEYATSSITATTDFTSDGLVEHQATGSIASTVTLEASGSLDILSSGSIATTADFSATATIEGTEYATGSIASTTIFEATSLVERQAIGLVEITSDFMSAPSLNVGATGLVSINSEISAVGSLLGEVFAEATATFNIDFTAEWIQEVSVFAEGTADITFGAQARGYRKRGKIVPVTQPLGTVVKQTAPQVLQFVIGSAADITNEMKTDSVHAYQVQLPANHRLVVSASQSLRRKNSELSTQIWISDKPYGMTVPRGWRNLNTISLLSRPTILNIVAKGSKNFIKDNSTIVLPAGTYYINIQNKSGKPSYYNFGLSTHNFT